MNLIKKNYNAGRLIFTNNFKKAVSDSELIFICVGTPTKKNSNEVDLSFVLKALRKLLNLLKIKNNYY